MAEAARRAIGWRELEPGRATQGRGSRLIAAAALAAVAMLASVVIAGPAAAHHGTGYRFVHDGPRVRMEILDSTVRTDVATGASLWEGAHGVHLDVTPARNGAAIRRACPQPKERGQVRICTYPYGWSRDDARAAPWTEGDAATGHAVTATIRIDTKGCCTVRVMKALICHELGHVLGLWHRPYGAGSCMTTPVDQAQPDRHDYRAVEGMYADHDHSVEDGAEPLPLPLALEGDWTQLAV